MNFRGRLFGLFRRLVGGVPWETVLKGKGVQEGLTLFKKEILKVQKQAISMCQKKRQWEKKNKSLLALEEGSGHSEGLKRRESVQGEN